MHLIDYNDAADRYQCQKQKLLLILKVCQTEFRFGGGFITTTQIACRAIAFKIGLIDCHALRIPAPRHTYRTYSTMQQEATNLVHKIVSCTFSELTSGALAQKAGNPAICRADLDAVHNSRTRVRFKVK